VLEALLVGCCVSTSTVVAPREVLLKAGLFDVGLQCCEDHDLWLKLAIAGNHFAYIEAALTEVRRRPDSLSADESIVARCSDRVYERLFSSGALPPSFQTRERFYLARCYLSSACRHLAQRDGSAALRSLAKASATRPASIRVGWLGMAVKAARVSRRSRPG
jgi:hypothetical protein